MAGATLRYRSLRFERVTVGLAKPARKRDPAPVPIRVTRPDWLRSVNPTRAHPPIPDSRPPVPVFPAPVPGFPSSKAPRPRVIRCSHVMNSPSPVRRWLTLVASFCILAIAFSFGLFSLPAFYPVLIRHFGWSHAAAVAGGSIVLLLIGTFSPVVGWLVDRYSPKAVLLCGVVTVALSLALLSSAQSLPLYYAYCLLLGIGTSAVSILPNSILIAPWFARGRASAVGLINAGIGMGGIAPALATSQFERRGIGGTFLFLALWMIIPFLLILLVVPRGERKTVSTRSSQPALNARAPSLAELLRMPLFWIFGLSVFFAAHAMVA